MYRRRRLVFRPFSVLYFLVLLIGLVIILPFAFLFLRDLLIRGLMLPPEMVGGLLLISLFGSFVNIPVAELKSRAPMFTYREVPLFGVAWHVPRMEMGTRTTLVTLNVGGALVPLIISAYILAYAIPHGDPDPLSAYGKVLLVLAVVALAVNRTSRIVKGLGIATPALVPPAITVLATLLVYRVGGISSPTLIAYAGGTLGALVGADLLNIRHLPKLGAPVVSIGGAGTFDGIYTTGIASVLLVLLLM
ncbi:hypothetical protein AC482_06010 [miscellaneous Crenarchaeota group-15 archaeon DG-45]|uniref:DUF1614 domain-containing protein n=1 Tax=miscellaneous Crenarchaeota group-15 archaeon DG-45 TaxID=1685127 RepID=A0A0M0BMJ9_9ARCH|nr:MAG: hypothetical protein AC482_06010 [miscellaneous Crenarchaeota group-15 archaeon DG-45]